jgi:hypothetical protein
MIINKEKEFKKIKNIATHNGGECLSSQYVNNCTKMNFLCSEKHNFYLTSQHLKRGVWCGRCRGGLLLDIEHCKKIAADKNGLCLSDLYINNKTPLRWRCYLGHEWSVSLGHVKSGTWCPYCGGTKKLDISYANLLAIQNNGVCLSNNYVGAMSKMQWQCNKGHKWLSSYNSVKNGKWCPKCAGNKPYSIEEVKEIAKNRGGECLSNEYVNSKNKLIFMCSKKHIFFTPFDGINQGKWCPECATGKGERICRAYFEAIFGEKFPKGRPKWLVNQKTNRPLELDGYCEKLGIAFEHQGEQHYKECSGIFKNQFEDIKRRDGVKRKLCKENNVLLVEIPEIGGLIKIKDVEKSIREIILKYGIDIKEKKLNIDIKDFFIKNENTYLEKLREFVNKKNGKLISNKYIGAREKYTIECSCGYRWETAPYNVYRGQWCPKCAKGIRGKNRRVRIICVENNTVYSSIREASSKLGIGRSNIGQVLIGNSKTAGGLRFIYHKP